jgi:hypothetical protein
MVEICAAKIIGQSDIEFHKSGACGARSPFAAGASWRGASTFNHVLADQLAVKM